MTSPVHDLSSHSDNGGADDQQKQSQGSQSHIRHPPPGTVLPGAALPSAEFMMMPHPSVGMGHNMGQTAYAYPDPYYASMMAAYGAQAPIHPNMVAMQQAGMPLPSGVIEEPVYVNAKQYHGILRRRQLRAKAESENKLIKSRKEGFQCQSLANSLPETVDDADCVSHGNPKQVLKVLEEFISNHHPYLHKSRHLHALKRARGCGGRFLNAKGNSDQTKEAPACSKLQSIDGPESSD